MNNAAFDNKSSKFVILVHSDKIDLIDRKSLECLSFILPAHGSMHGCADKEILDWISNRILGTGSSMEPSEISKEVWQGRVPPRGVGSVGKLPSAATVRVRRRRVTYP
jgi:hypothetical protein